MAWTGWPPTITRPRRHPAAAEGTGMPYPLLTETEQAEADQAAVTDPAEADQAFADSLRYEAASDQAYAREHMRRLASASPLR